MNGRSGEQRPAKTSPVPHSRLPPTQLRRIYIGEVVASATPMLLQTMLGAWRFVFGTRLHVPVV
jgi:hypothetical protein